MSEPLTPIATQQTQAMRPGLLQLGVWSLCAYLAGVGLAFILGSNAGWADQPLRAALLGGLPVAIGSAAGLVILGFMLSLRTVALALGVVGAGVVRMLVSLTLGLLLYFAATPEGRTFWTAFLAANLLALVVESMWGIVNNKSASGVSGAATVGATE